MRTRGAMLPVLTSPGAIQHTDIDEDITMVLNGRLAELMVQVAPNLYRKYSTVNRKGTAILYVKMQKALHGLLPCSSTRSLWLI